MTNIIKFPEPESFKYIECDNRISGVTGKFDTDVDMEVDASGDARFIVCGGGNYAVATRKEMAQFLWAAAYFLDSDQEWAESEYPALNK